MAMDHPRPSDTVWWRSALLAWSLGMPWGRPCLAMGPTTPGGWYLGLPLTMTPPTSRYHTMSIGVTSEESPNVQEAVGENVPLTQRRSSSDVDPELKPEAKPSKIRDKCSGPLPSDSEIGRGLLCFMLN
jgi:hypothetical protein